MERLKELNLLARVCKDLSTFLGIAGESCKDMGEFVLGLWKENPSQIAFSKALRETELPEPLISSLYKTVAALTAPLSGITSNTSSGGNVNKESATSTKNSAFTASLAIIDSEPVPLEKFRGGATGLSSFDDADVGSGSGRNFNERDDEEPLPPSMLSST